MVLCPDYHPGSPGHPIPLALSKSYCSSTHSSRQTFLALLPLNLISPPPHPPTPPPVIPESLLSLLWRVAHHMHDYSHYLCWRQSSGSGRARVSQEHRPICGIKFLSSKQSHRPPAPHQPWTIFIMSVLSGEWCGAQHVLHGPLPLHPTDTSQS